MREIGNRNEISWITMEAKIMRKMEAKVMKIEIKERLMMIEI